MPIEWDEYIFVFPGTVLCDDDYNLQIPYIYPLICRDGAPNDYSPSGYVFYDQPFYGHHYKLLRVATK